MLKFSFILPTCMKPRVKINIKTQAAMDTRLSSAGTAWRLRRPKFARGRTSLNASRSWRRVSCRVADRVLVLWLGVRPEPLRWEIRVQDIGPPETYRSHIISNGESSPRDLHLNAKTQLHSMTSKLQCWTPYAKQLARQEHKPTH